MKANIDQNGVLQITPDTAKEAELLDNWIVDNQCCLTIELCKCLNISTSFQKPRRKKGHKL